MTKRQQTISRFQKDMLKMLKGIRLDMIFFFLGNKSTKTLRVEDIKVLNMMLKGTKGNKKYIGDAMNTKVQKYILYIFLK